MAEIGIDLGTTYSVGAYVAPDGSIKILDNKEGDSSTPSVVSFEDDENIVVGRTAKKNAIIRPEDVVSDTKNYMGKKKVLHKKDGKEYTPEMVSSFILRKIVNDSAAALGEKIDGAVVTVPAYFADSERKATKDAVTMAGVALLGMISEPTAAALCYVKGKNVANENLLIYDFGGGTFDVTILHVDEKQHIEVCSTDGLRNVGGRFLDQEIVDYVVEYMQEKYGVDLEDDEFADDLQELNNDAEEAKIQLSSRDSASIIVKIIADCGKISECIEITRADFEKMVDKFYRRTEVKMKDALNKAGLQKSDINRVLLVGGTSRIPYIAEKVRDYMGFEPSKDIDPDEAVAMGAAIFAKCCMSKDDILTDVCSHSIGMTFLNSQGVEENDIIIKKNSKLPAKNEQSYRTMKENQEFIRLTITEGEYRELTDVTIIGKYRINLPQGVPKGSLVTVAISLDRNQLLHIHVKVPDFRIDEEYYLNRLANMDDAEVEKMTEVLGRIRIK